MNRKKTVKIRNLEGRSAEGYTTFGCCWERGDCTKEAQFDLQNEQGEKVPVQSRILAWWPDGSVKWSAHTIDAGKLKNGGSISIGTEEGSLKEGLKVEKKEQGWLVDNGVLRFLVKEQGENFLEEAGYRDRTVRFALNSVLLLEECKEEGYEEARKVTEYRGENEKTELLECGPVCAVFRFSGTHKKGATQKIPYHILMKVGYGEENLHFTYTFFYDGDQETDRLKGIGLRLQGTQKGEIFNRHVKFAGDNGVFHENAVLLLGGKKFSWEVYEAQNQDRLLSKETEEFDKIKENLELFPHWDQYTLCQDRDNHFVIEKRIHRENCCKLECLHGKRAGGAAAFGNEEGSILLGIRDAWQKYPSGFSIKGLCEDTYEAVLWLWSPGAESMDFRHYTDTGYSQVYYEGFPWKGADPKGIASTSELEISLCRRLIPTDEEVEAFAKKVNHPPRYVCTPEHYHDCKAFGLWSLPRKDTEAEKALEKQIEDFTDFYMNEVEQRKWYGLFNFGDVMHTYDSYRHVWRYDMGGFAWDNTELVPDYWIWYQFLRTGREDVFSFGERMTRHVSEVDIYHLGDLQGTGSRHNVRHWGCACKEVRVAMAGHYRFYYYLTGDYRLEEIFEEIGHAPEALEKKDPLGSFYEKEDMVYPTHARSGPDWSSLCSNWMTDWERTQDPEAKEKILTGIRDIGKAPLRLCSGPDFEFEAESCHLRYIGERTTGGCHLQICMGAAQTFTELEPLLQEKQWTEMLTEYGQFYFFNREEQLRLSKGIIGEKIYSLPSLACGIGAYAAERLQDKALARTVWCFLLKKWAEATENSPFVERKLADKGNVAELTERTGVSTNEIGQWCLNTIMCLEMIPDSLPGSKNEIRKMIEENPEDLYRKDY